MTNPNSVSENYPYLPPGRAFIYVPLSDPFMAETKKITLELSTVTRQPTGAVIVKDGKILGRGANQVKLKNRALLDLHSRYCIRKIFGVKSGTKYWLCPGCATHKQHAEPNGIRDAKNNHGDIAGADLYHWGHWWCCKPCWDAMIAAGIRNVYLVEGATLQFKR